HADVVKALLAAHASPDQTDDLNGATALMWIGSSEMEEGGGPRPTPQQRLEVAKILLAAGANVNLQNAWGGTALQWAADAGILEVVQALVKAGANVNLGDR